MTKKENGIKKFFNKLWHEIEPFIRELIVYLVVILTVALVGYWTKPYLDDKLKDAVDIIKWIVVIGSLSLFALHTLVTIFIRVMVGVSEEVKEAYYRIKEIRQADPDLLEAGTTFDEIGEIQSFETRQLNKTGKKHDWKE
jgi:hypothetical protein